MNNYYTSELNYKFFFLWGARPLSCWYLQLSLLLLGKDSSLTLPRVGYVNSYYWLIWQVVLECEGDALVMPCLFFFIFTYRFSRFVLSKASSSMSNGSDSRSFVGCFLSCFLVTFILEVIISLLVKGAGVNYYFSFFYSLTSSSTWILHFMCDYCCSTKLQHWCMSWVSCCLFRSFLLCSLVWFVWIKLILMESLFSLC